MPTESTDFITCTCTLYFKLHTLIYMNQFTSALQTCRILCIVWQCVCVCVCVRVCMCVCVSSSLSVCLSVKSSLWGHCGWLIHSDLWPLMAVQWSWGLLTWRSRSRQELWAHGVWTVRRYRGGMPVIRNEEVIVQTLASAEASGRFWCWTCFLALCICGCFSVSEYIYLNRTCTLLEWLHITSSLWAVVIQPKRLFTLLLKYFWFHQKSKKWIKNFVSELCFFFFAL